MLPRWNFQNQVNAVGGLAIAVVGGYLAWDMTRSTELPPCSARFDTPTQMSFQKSDGTVLTPPEFQARVGIERGVIEKTKIQRVIGDKPLILTVALGGPSSDDSGARFGWTLPGISKAQSACLAYNIFVPSDFQYGDGGMLPGLFGQAAGKVADDAISGVAAQLVWTDQGQIAQGVRFSGSTAALNASPNLQVSTRSVLPRGRWARIEQEAVLNTPGVADGVSRVWVDGKIVLNEPNIPWRSHGGIQWSGTLADVSYVAGYQPIDRKPTYVQITPPQMSWR